MANRTNNDLQNTAQKIRFEQHEPHKNRAWTHELRKGKKFLLQ